MWRDHRPSCAGRQAGSGSSTAVRDSLRAGRASEPQRQSGRLRTHNRCHIPGPSGGAQEDAGGLWWAWKVCKSDLQILADAERIFCFTFLFNIDIPMALMSVQFIGL